MNDLGASKTEFTNSDCEALVAVKMWRLLKLPPLLPAREGVASFGLYLLVEGTATLFW